MKGRRLRPGSGLNLHQHVDLVVLVSSVFVEVGGILVAIQLREDKLCSVVFTQST